MSDRTDVDSIVYAFRRNVVVAASAGTGKTHRLTALYVLLVLGLTSMGERSDTTVHEAVDPARIVATTFSRAAAHEIRTRIERALRGLASGEGAGALDEAIARRCAVLGLSLGSRELAERAAKALERWPHARIDTLHGVALDLVRKNALALGASPRLSIEEEEAGRGLVAAVLDEVIGRAFEEGGERGAAARALVSSTAGVIYARDAIAQLFGRLDEDGIDVDELAPADLDVEARARLAELSAIAKACAVDASRKSLGSAASDLARAIARSPEATFDDEATAALTALFVEKKPGEKMTTAERQLFAFKDGLKGSTKPTNAALAKNLARLFAEAPELSRIERGVLSLLAETHRELDRERRARGVASFGDILRLARDGLRDEAEVAKTARASIDVLMVDEFQDTSAVQRDIVYLLRERESSRRSPGAAPVASELIDHGLFVVGDRKQSIYGFRGADVAVFSRVAADLAGQAASDALGLRAPTAGSRPTADFVALRESRRSGERIVSFVNAFSQLDFASRLAGGAEAQDFDVSYREAEHLVASAETADPGKVVFVDDRGGEVSPPEPLLAGDDPALREAFVAASFAWHATTELGYAPRDVAVLARRRATIPLVELALFRLGVPYVVAGRALYEASEVRDVAALVRLVVDPRDRHAMAAVLRGPLVSLSDEALLSLTHERGLAEDLLEKEGERLDAKAFPEESARLRVFRDRFVALREPLLRMPAGEALDHAVKRLDLDRVIAALPRAAARLANVDRLVGIGRERGGTLASFSMWLDRQIADETDEAEAAVFSADDDAVRLTTIHASKGLDFEVVVLVDLQAPARAIYPAVSHHTGADGRPRLVVRHRGSKGGRIPSLVTEEAGRERRAREGAERRRLTYVAITRARKLLALIGRSDDPPGGSALETWLHGRGTGLFDEVETLAAEELVGRALEGALPPSQAGNDVELVADPPFPPPRRIARLPIATTPLDLFRGCARRFRLRFVLGLEEPVASGQLELFEASPPPIEAPPPSDDDEGVVDPRALGRAAHRVLETWPRERWGADAGAEIETLLAAEGLSADESMRLAVDLVRIVSGPFGARLADPALTLRRELEIVHEVAGEPSLSLRGTVDLFVEPTDAAAPLEVIDYKLSSPTGDLRTYAFQLRAYALALSRRFPGRAVRAGVLFLRGGAEPQWLAGKGPLGTLADAEHEAFEGELAVLAGRLATARATDTFPGIPLDACRALRCGFVTACHRSADRPARKR